MWFKKYTAYKGQLKVKYKKNHYWRLTFIIYFIVINKEEIWYRDRFVYAPSQWETTLLRNVISYWLVAYTKWSLLVWVCSHTWVSTWLLYKTSWMQSSVILHHVISEVGSTWYELNLLLIKSNWKLYINDVLGYSCPRSVLNYIIWLLSMKINRLPDSGMEQVHMQFHTEIQRQTSVTMLPTDGRTDKQKVDRLHPVYLQNWLHWARV